MAMWWWSGLEPIPGKRAGARGLQGNDLVWVAALGAAIAIGTVLGQMQNVASSFAWTFFAGAIKISVLASTRMKLLYCPKCGTTRWAQLYRNAWYCPRCGKKLQSPNDRQLPLSSTLTDGTVRIERQTAESASSSVFLERSKERLHPPGRARNVGGSRDAVRLFLVAPIASVGGILVIILLAALKTPLDWILLTLALMTTVGVGSLMGGLRKLRRDSKP